MIVYRNKSVFVYLSDRNLSQASVIFMKLWKQVVHSLKKFIENEQNQPWVVEI